MSLWKTLLQHIETIDTTNAMDLRFFIETQAREALIPCLLDYAKDPFQAKDTRHCVLIRLSQLFSETELSYSAHFPTNSIFELLLPELIESSVSLLKDQDEMVRGCAIMVLEKVDAVEHLDLIRTGLDDSSSYVRHAALQAINHLEKWVPTPTEPEQVLKSYQKHLKDRDGDNRVSAVKRLLDLFHETEYHPAYEAIVHQLLHDRAAYVRYEIASHLGDSSQDPSFIVPLVESAKKDIKNRPASLMALVQLGKVYPIPSDIFIESLMDEDWRNASTAALGIKSLRFHEAIPNLIHALEENADMENKTSSYAEALASFKSGAAEAGPALWQAFQKYKLSSGYLKTDLIKAFVDVTNDPAVITDLLDVLTNPYLSPGVKDHALKGLKKLGWQGEEHIFGRSKED